jgi:hypothetical protein
MKSQHLLDLSKKDRSPELQIVLPQEEMVFIQIMNG